MEQDIMAERVRVAREIHDGLAQQIAALGYELDALSTHPGVNPVARVETRRIRTELSGTLENCANRCTTSRTTPLHCAMKSNPFSVT